MNKFITSLLLFSALVAQAGVENQDIIRGGFGWDELVSGPSEQATAVVVSHGMSTNYVAKHDGAVTVQGSLDIYYQSGRGLTSHLNVYVNGNLLGTDKAYATHQNGGKFRNKQVSTSVFMVTQVPVKAGQSVRVELVSPGGKVQGKKIVIIET